MEILIEATFKLEHIVSFDADIKSRDIRSIEVYGQDVHTELRNGTILHARISPPDKDPVKAFYTILPKSRKKKEPPVVKKKQVRRKPKPVKEEAPAATFPSLLSSETDETSDLSVDTGT